MIIVTSSLPKSSIIDMFSVHIKTQSWRFQILLVWIAFVKIFVSVTVFRGRLIERWNKVAFSKFSSEVSLLAEVSHDEAKWNARRENSASFRRVSHHACARIFLTTGDVFVTCDTTQRTGLRAKFQGLQLSFSQDDNWSLILAFKERQLKPLVP